MVSRLWCLISAWIVRLVACQTAWNVSLPSMKNEVEVYHLCGEAKTGTTWIREMIVDIFESSCDLVRARGDLHTCNLQTDEKHVFKWEWRFGENTRTVIFSDLGKHVIPFVSIYDHPNGTPFFNVPIAPWVHECISTGRTDCMPPRSRLSFDRVIEHYSMSRPELKRARKFLLDQDHSVRRGSPVHVHFITTSRDPRAIAVSAAHYRPGHALFGGKRYKKRTSINIFSRAQINTTAFWIGFRTRWFRKLSLIFPHTELYYEDLVRDARPSLARLAHDLGVHYNQEMIEKIAAEHTQKAYQEKNITQIRNVPVVRGEDRPKDAINGFMAELSEMTLRVVNNSMEKLMSPELCERFLAHSIFDPHQIEWAPYRVPKIVDTLRKCCPLANSHFNRSDIYFADTTGRQSPEEIPKFENHMKGGRCLPSTTPMGTSKRYKCSEMEFFVHDDTHGGDPLQF